jgi:hypothetical protein
MDYDFASPEDFYKFLLTAMHDRGASALVNVAECAAANREVFIKTPCVVALACWGDAGFGKIVENATRNPTSKNISAAIKTLAFTASGKPITAIPFFVHNIEVLDEINRCLADRKSAKLARRWLVELVMVLATDDLMIPLGGALGQVSMSPDVVREIVAAIGGKWLHFGAVELEAFERLLWDRGADEPAIHSFLERYPQILDPMAIQVWSKPDFHGFKEPDFLVRRSDDTYLVIEIENAAKMLVTQAGQLSASASLAVKQVNDYRSFVLERLPEARSHFPNIHDPDALVVIGMEQNLGVSQVHALRQENHSRSKLRIVGFDWMLNRARTVLSNVTASGVEVYTFYRFV